MQHTGYVARVLFGFFNICTAACLCWRTPHQSRCVAFGQEGGEISDGPLFPSDPCYCPRVTPADPICYPAEFHLVVESSSVPKESCGLLGLKITCLRQKVLPVAEHSRPLCSFRAARAAPAQAPK